MLSRFFSSTSPNESTVQSFISYATSGDLNKIAPLCPQMKKDQQSLHSAAVAAAQNNQTHIIQYLFSQNLVPKAIWEQLIQIASENGFSELLSYLFMYINLKEHTHHSSIDLDPITQFKDVCPYKGLALIHASRYNQVGIVCMLMNDENTFQKTIAEKDFCNALAIATEQNYEEILGFMIPVLLKKNATLDRKLLALRNSEEDTEEFEKIKEIKTKSLYYLAQFNQLELLKLCNIEECETDIKEVILCQAVEHGHPSIVEYLIAIDSYINIENACLIALSHQQPHILQYLLSNNKRDTSCSGTIKGEILKWIFMLDKDDIIQKLFTLIAMSDIRNLKYQSDNIEPNNIRDLSEAMADLKIPNKQNIPDEAINEAFSLAKSRDNPDLLDLFLLYYPNIYSKIQRQQLGTTLNMSNSSSEDDPLDLLKIGFP